MKFSIRDLLFVTVIVAIALGWWVDHARLYTQSATWRHCTGALEKAFGEFGVSVEWTEDRSEVKVVKKSGDLIQQYEFYTNPYEPGTQFYRHRASA
jgi:hypothetical protein